MPSFSFFLVCLVFFGLFWAIFFVFNEITLYCCQLFGMLIYDDVQ